MDGTIKLWDVATKEEISTRRGHDAWVNAAVFSMDNQTLVSASDDGTVKFWNVDPERNVEGMAILPTPPVTFPSALPGAAFQSRWPYQQNAIHLVAFAGESGPLITASEDGSLQVHQLAPPDRASGWVIPADHCEAIAFSEDGTQIIASASDGLVRAFDAATSTLRRSISIAGTSIYSVALSLGLQRLAASLPDGTLTLWDWSASQEIWTQPATQSRFRVAFSPDGQLFELDDQEIRQVDLASGQRKLLLRLARGRFPTISFSADGRSAAICIRGGPAQLWDLRKPRRLASLLGHAGGPSHAAFAPDGRTLATCGNDGAVRLWSLANHREIMALPGSVSTFSKLAFSPDGRTLAGFGSDRSVRLWQAGSAEPRN
ncbi:MAG: hypothetical protein L0Z50_03470 [Verrucomicrobiales bacterium]|nr:hypothetical protein [Verrucomicrobiales bacterium]